MNGSIDPLISRLRKIGYLECCSYLLLLIVAMPLKYVFDIPSAVRYIGAAHGLIFVWYLFAVRYVARVKNWSLEDRAEAYAASILPLGPFLLETGTANPTISEPSPSK